MDHRVEFDDVRDGPMCEHCGCLLRGVRSAVCVECGRPRRRRLTFFDSMEFDAFRAAFDLASVPYGWSDPHTGVLGMETHLDHVSPYRTIWLQWIDLTLAEQALEHVGLSLPPALIDQDHPWCPCCGFSVRDRDTEELRCEVCGTRCAWFEGSTDAQGLSG